MIDFQSDHNSFKFLKLFSKKTGEFVIIALKKADQLKQDLQNHANPQIWSFLQH